MGILLVTAAIIRNKDKLLISQRKPGSHQEMKWEFPGGKLETGEDPEDCLKREILEELNITINVKRIYKVVSHHYENKHVILLCYLCEMVAGIPENLDCHDFQWVTVEQITNFDFAPADLPVVAQLQLDFNNRTS